MYCPKCSQQQVSDRVRFCTRCGFPLDVVSALLSNDGDLIRSQADANVSLWCKTAARLAGSKLLLLGILLVPVAFLFQYLFNSPLGFFPAVILIGAGVIQEIIHGVIRQIRDVKTPHRTREKILNAADKQLNLPAATGIPIPHPRSLDTAEMVKPPSVTENTTKLLDNDHPIGEDERE